MIEVRELGVGWEQDDPRSERLGDQLLCGAKEHPTADPPMLGVEGRVASEAWIPRPALECWIESPRPSCVPRRYGSRLQVRPPTPLAPQARQMNRSSRLRSPFTTARMPRKPQGSRRLHDSPETRNTTVTFLDRVKAARLTAATHRGV